LAKNVASFAPRIDASNLALRAGDTIPSISACADSSVVERQCIAWNTRSTHFECADFLRRYQTASTYNPIFYTWLYAQYSPNHPLAVALDEVSFQGLEAVEGLAAASDFKIFHGLSVCLREGQKASVVFVA